jgi:NADPH-dependent curcumin reductase CurA
MLSVIVLEVCLVGQEYFLGGGEGLSKVPENVDPEMVLAVFALPGMTATQGLYGFGHPKAGETIVVSGAAGSVGSIVGQLAKADGLNVIGVAGDEEKCHWICDELGFDGAINYKRDDIAAKLSTLAPKGVDIYFENTGGPIQQHVFDRMNAHGRIVVCGMISDYASATPSAGPNWIPLIKKAHQYSRVRDAGPFGRCRKANGKTYPLCHEGRIKFRTHVLEGVESAIEGLNLFLNGGNRGKLIVKL